MKWRPWLHFSSLAALNSLFYHAANILYGWTLPSSQFVSFVTADIFFFLVRFIHNHHIKLLTQRILRNETLFNLREITTSRCTPCMAAPFRLFRCFTCLQWLCWCTNLKGQEGDCYWFHSISTLVPFHDIVACDCWFCRFAHINRINPARD